MVNLTDSPRGSVCFMMGVPGPRGATGATGETGETGTQGTSIEAEDNRQLYGNTDVGTQPPPR